MIEQLNGIHETVRFSEGSSLKIYLNVEHSSYPTHWHTPIEIIIPVEHNYYVTCNNKTYELNAGDIFIISSGTLHSISACPNGSRYILQVDFSVLNQFRDFEFLTTLLSPCLLIKRDDSNSTYCELFEIIVQITEEYNLARTLSEAFIYSKLILLFVMIGRNVTNALPDIEALDHRQQKYAKNLLSVCDHINKHCTENLTLDEISAFAGFSKYHFSRLFKDFYGKSFYKYLNTQRIMFAQSLLIDPDLSVTEVAARSGYDSLSAFIRMFKICRGCTPSEYRSMYIR